MKKFDKLLKIKIDNLFITMCVYQKHKVMMWNTGGGERVGGVGGDDGSGISDGVDGGEGGDGDEGGDGGEGDEGGDGDEGC